MNKSHHRLHASHIKEKTGNRHIISHFVSETNNKFRKTEYVHLFCAGYMHESISSPVCVYVTYITLNGNNI